MDINMSDMISNVKKMIDNGNLPPDIHNLINNMSSNNTSNSNNTHNNNIDLNDIMKNVPPDFINNLSSMLNTNSDTNTNSNCQDNSTPNNQNNQNNFNIDINTMLKMKSIIDSMNKQQNDPRANLLRSLKPYLKPSRKEKVEQYIKIFSMGKMFEVLNPLGGEKNNDV